MCQVAPGPRCSSHAKKDLARAIKEVEVATQAVENGIHEFFSSDEEAILIAKRETAWKRLNEKQDEYHATPEGIRLLKAVVRESTGYTREQALKMLKKAETRRLAQKTALKLAKTRYTTSSGRRGWKDVALLSGHTVSRQAAKVELDGETRRLHAIYNIETNQQVGYVVTDNSFFDVEVYSYNLGGQTSTWKPSTSESFDRFHNEFNSRLVDSLVTPLPKVDVKSELKLPAAEAKKLVNEERYFQDVVTKGEMFPKSVYNAHRRLKTRLSS